eukprot:CFRG3898T1
MAERRTTLPAKEAANFKQILKFYESKQYKKGLKMCESILKRHHNHGETLSMKGLCLNGLNRKEEAYHFGREGLKHDMNSHVCWHVYGLIYRSDKNYVEAIKCYQNALKHDQNNILILRDLSSLQIQLRDLEGFKDTRYQLVQLRSQARVSWIGLAMSYHMLKDYKMARDILQVYADTLKKSETGPAEEKNITMQYEQSELLLYKAMIVHESGDHNQALKILDDNKIDIVDVQSFKELRSQLLLEANRFEDAEKSYRDMIQTNPDQKTYYMGLESCRRGQKDEATSETDFADELVGMYKQLVTTYPRSITPKIRLLQIAPVAHGVFREELEILLKRSLRKGLISLYASAKPLYSSREKVSVIEEVAEGYLKELLKTNKLTAVDNLPESPATRVYLEYFLIRHHIKRGHLERAMELVETSLSHSPTFIELYTAKARIFKVSGDYAKAADVMDEVRSLDTADRYLNSKCGKYMLRANRPTQAQDTVGLFTREGVDQGDNINEMQCMWFENESGDCHLRSKSYGPALKKYHQIEKHFVDITEDQFDFHNYCMRKVTLRAYINMLRLEDNLRDHVYFKNAAMSGIRAYLAVHAKQTGNVSEVEMNSVKSTGIDQHSEDCGLSAKELKKLRSKQRREAARAEQEKSMSSTGVTTDTTKEISKKEVKEVDKDPNGLELAKTKVPLDDAVNTFLKSLLKFAASDVETHTIAAEVYIARKRYALALKSIIAGARIQKSNPSLHLQIVRFAMAVTDKAVISEFPESVKTVVETSMPSILENGTINDFVEKYINDHSTSSMAHILAGYQASVIVNGKSTEITKRAVSALSKYVMNMSSDNINARRIRYVQQTLHSEFAEDACIEDFKIACMQKCSMLTLI